MNGSAQFELRHFSMFDRWRHQINPYRKFRRHHLLGKRSRNRLVCLSSLFSLLFFLSFLFSSHIYYNPILWGFCLVPVYVLQHSKELHINSLTHFIRNTILVVVTLFIQNTILVVVRHWGVSRLLAYRSPVGRFIYR